MQWVTPRQYYNPFTCSTGLLNRLVQRHGPPSRVREQGHNPSQSEKEQLYQLRDLATRGHQFTDNSIFIMLSSCIYSDSELRSNLQQHVHHFLILIFLL